MKNKKILITSIIIGILVLSIGLSYAVMKFNILGTKNSQLVLGDIYMHYKENNQLVLTDNDIVNANIVPDTKNVGLLQVNPIMTEQDNYELSKCVSIFTELGFNEGLEEGLSLTSFCQGTGKINGWGGYKTLQQYWDDFRDKEGFMNAVGPDLINNNIIILENDKYIVNPIMASQEVVEVVDNELSNCVNFLFDTEMPLSSGTMVDFCKGTGTADGLTFQENLDNGNWFPEEMVQELLTLNVVIENEIEYTSFELNPVLESQEVVENELIRCVNYFDMADAPYDVGSNGESFCKGTGTVMGGLTLQQLWDNSYQQEGFMEQVGNELVNNNIMILENGGYVVNPVMASQEVVNNELSKCIAIVGNMEIQVDEGSTIKTYCKGIGTSNGISFKDMINDLTDSEKRMFLNNNIIIPVIEEVPYFEFTISGKNTYSNKDIYYDIILNHGDNHETRKTRIRDDLLRFSLVKIVDGEETIMFENMSYDNLNNKNILRETIAKNTMDEVNITYRLYMGFYEGIRVGVVGPNSNQTVDYDFDTWNNEVYGSIKVNVKGGLVD